MRLQLLPLRLSRGKTYIVIFFLGILLFAFLAGIQFIFSVKTITVRGTKEGQAINGLSSLGNKNIVLLSTKKAEQQLYYNNPYLASVFIQKNYPDDLIVTVTFQKPLAYLEVNNGYFLLSGKGRILEKKRVQEEIYPVVHYYQKLNFTAFQSGDTIDYQDIRTALHFLQKALDLGEAINTIDIIGSDVIALVGSERKIVVTTEKETGLQEYQMETIIRQFKVEGKDFKVLDVRFDKPVVELK